MEKQTPQEELDQPSSETTTLTEVASTQDTAGAELLKLTKDEVIQICGIADGIRLFNTLDEKVAWAKLTIYVCHESQQLREHKNGEQGNGASDVYHAIYLEELTSKELTEKLAKLINISHQINQIYKQGPTGINVLISDKNQNFEDESNFVLDKLKAETNDSYTIILK